MRGAADEAGVSLSTDAALEAFGVPDLGADAPAGAYRWARAVALGGRGRAAAARQILAELVSPASAGAVDPAIASLAYGTRGSLIRQAGEHGRARMSDGRACLIAADRPTASGGGDPWMVAAWLDGVIGLAADNLGVGDFGASRALLRRAEAELAAQESACSTDVNWAIYPRVRLRHAWVSTELALYSGDSAGVADGRALVRSLARDTPSHRHVVKSTLICAAADAASGDPEAAVDAAQWCEKQCGPAGLLPLAWASATMIQGLSPSRMTEVGRVDILGEQLTVLGMPITPAT
ncbi:hypothetical protein [Gordonia zhaorongruii]|uniref:hypothetical protein n=1 Tax=Gordonia zhaorongruii TaxID=2597659 RepID=UPI0010432405|nr:hypothetical protein [Gordonia zhaorongruii]